MRLITILLFINWITFIMTHSVAAQTSWDQMLDTGQPSDRIQVKDGELLVTGSSASLTIPGPDSRDYQVTCQLKLAPSGTAVFVEVLEAGEASAASRVQVARENDGARLVVAPMIMEDQRWRSERNLRYNMTAVPRDAGALSRLEADGLSTRAWNERWVELRVRIVGRTASVWIEGMFVHAVELKQQDQARVALTLQQGDRARHLLVESVEAHERFLTVDLTHQIRGHDGAELDNVEHANQLLVDGVPYVLPRGQASVLDLSHARWIDEQRDPDSYREPYDGGPDVLHDRRMPMLRVPSADYVAAHVLAVADGDPEKTRTFTLRAGRYGFSTQTVQYDFLGQVPQADADAAGALVETPAGHMQAIRVPLWAAFAQDIEHYMDISITREVRMARRHPDPNRFRYRPVGLPSGVRIAALTLERSPITLRVTSSETGHAFVEPQRPVFDVHLHNITSQPQTYTLRVEGESLAGVEFPAVHRKGQLAPGESRIEQMTPAPPQRGYYELRVLLGGGDEKHLLTRRTSFAVLPPDTRQHRESSPFGTWDFGATHFSAGDADRVGPLYVKMGLRYGMFPYTAEERARYGVRQGQNPAIRMIRRHDPENPLEVYLTRKQNHLDLLPLLMLFHEDHVNRDHVTRTIDLMHDYPPYVLDETEQARINAMIERATSAARAMRELDPSVHISLGNGSIATREELYRQGFPPELFDSAANESASYGRMPETQPTDNNSLNASIWMDRQLLDHYGLHDKPVTLAYEVCSVNTNPGNVPLAVQADYYPRHALHFLAWRMPLIRIGLVHDVGTSYRFSNWGSSGFVRMMPELNVKPSFVAYATLTRVLDGATFDRIVPTDSQSVYALAFNLPGGETALAMWTVRGQRPVTVMFDTPGQRTVIDSQGNDRILESATTSAITISSSPVYLVGPGQVKDIQLGTPVYHDAPRGRAAVIDTLDSLENWQVETDPDPVLEFYNPISPRRIGRFTFETVTSEHRGPVLQVTPQPIDHGKTTMSMYMGMRHKTGIPVSGKPTQVGVWINGNSGWGRVIFEFKDASGQTWTSIGAPTPGDPPRWWFQRTTAEQRQAMGTARNSDWNTVDVHGHGRINFDGWRYVGIDMPGQYPGGSYPWPGTSQWRNDQGDRTVRYPLTLHRVIVELNENVLNVMNYQPVLRPSIQLSNITVSQEDIDQPKQWPWDW